MNTRRSYFLIVAIGFGFAFLYLPIVMLVVYSFNASKLVTVWAGFSTKWYGELVHDPALLKADVLEIPVQVNGKVRGKISVPAEAQEAEVIEIAKADSNVGKHLAGQSVKRAIYVRGRIVNFVVGG